MTLRPRRNPVLPGWYADPELHAFDGRFYIYPTCSKPYEEQTYFEVWSSADLVEWENRGVILDLQDVPWSTQRAAWAPSVALRDGTYFLYFSAGDGAGIGVAASARPDGPFRDILGSPLIREHHHGAQPIDAHAFLDDDGCAYLYFGGWGRCVAVKLGDDMASTSGPFYDITPPGYVEGPFMLKRSGAYYLMWSEGGWGDETYCVCWGRADSWRGPFPREGCLLSTDPAIATSPGHSSVLAVPSSGQHWIAYHRRPLGETDRHRRVVCIDPLCFDAAGRILPVQMSS